MRLRSLAAIGLAITIPASAQAGVELGGVAGLHTFSQDSALGVVEQGGVNQNPDGLKNSTFFGLRLGVYFNKQMGIEVEAGGIPTEPRQILFDIWMVAARAQFVYQLRNEPTTRLIPFLQAGAGLIQIVDVGVTSNEAIVAKDMKIAPFVGGGAKFRAANGWGVRADLRAMLPPKDGGGVVLEVEVLASMFKDFGYKAPKKKDATPLPKDDDPDKDGIKGAADKCPNEPEDKDGFEDEDGCPDKDNDKDGIPDEKDGPGGSCKDQPEDKDGFQDEDGCPDPDNDNDGIPDAQDKCPDKPETKNGYQDDDGCPDEVPETLKKFTGAIQGINFQVGSEALAAGTNVVLDKAVAVLKEFGDVKLEVQGHTDDQQLRAGGRFPDNTALSQARAESVKKYMVSKGIADDRVIAKGYGDAQPVVDPKGLTGAPLNNARTKNRRVEFKLVEGSGGAGAPAPAPTPAPKAPAAPAPAPTPAPKAPAAPAPKAPAAPAPTPAPTKP